MPNRAETRVKKEFEQFIGFEEIGGQCSIKIEVVDGQWSCLRGEITGPADTPYEGGNFVLDIKVPDTFPFNPPKVRFLTRVWHPNVSSESGAFSERLLKDSWVVSSSLRAFLLSLQVWLSAGEPDYIEDMEVGLQFKEHQDMFQLTAQHWTNAYAGGSHTVPGCDAKIQRLRELNTSIDEHGARLILSKENWNLEKAADSMFG
ncbi:ubiquitin-conjugating enzyme E2-22 kDa-like [Drosophila miranda]|uniref:ubiquitin-conjugating enzyme E2-22 kDa-like n=1 Tax=Drosophila miranda TaxID=7229 RepID=UPI0007E7D15E|nr:ubiquitin-conjugating enzyme E2-22 kDa-like [Drosophila miranda]